MKKLAGTQILYFFFALILFPDISFAQSIASAQASELAAEIVDGKVEVTFKESANSDIKGYLILRKSGVGYLSPNVPNGTRHTVSTQFVLHNPWEVWEVITNNNDRSQKITLEQDSYTYLLYMRDQHDNYSKPVRIVVNNSYYWSDADLTTDMLILTGGTFHINNGRKLTLLRNDGLVGFAGALQNDGLFEVQNLVRVPKATSLLNGNGTIEIKNGGELLVEGRFKSLYRGGALLVNPGGKVKVSSGASFILDQGLLQLKSGASMAVSGTLEVLPNSTGIYKENGADFVFANGSRFNLRKQMPFPMAVWEDGATLAYYGDWYQDKIPTGLNQEFYNFIWNMAGTQGTDMNLLCGLKVRGTLRVESTNGKLLTLGNCNNYQIGNIEIGSGAKVELPANTTFKKDLVLNGGTITTNGVLNLEGGLELSNNASITSSTGWCTINFTNSSGQNNSSLLTLPTGLDQTKARWSINITTGRTITLGSDVELGGSTSTISGGEIVVHDGAKLLLGNKVVKNASTAANTSFTVMDGGMLGVGHTQGISNLANTGAIRTDKRSFSSKADYEYNGASAQATGNALPNTVRKLTVNAGSTVELTNNQTISDALVLQAGILKIGSITVTVKGDMLLKQGGLAGNTAANLVIANSLVQSKVEIPAVTLASLLISSKGDVVLRGNATISRELNMQHGVLQTANSKVILNPSALLSETANSYILGTVETDQATPDLQVPYTFSNIGLTLTYKGTAAGTTRVSRFTGPVADQPNGLMINRTFSISTAVKSGLNASMSFSYMRHELKELMEDDLELYRSTDGGASYTNRGRSSIDKNNAVVYLDGIDAFSTWTLGTNPMPLPVELMNFEAVRDAKGMAKLSWATATEKNNSHFEVERTVNGTTWERIGTVAGTGNSTTKQVYAFTDTRFSVAGTFYYRLKQVDTDGTVSYSKVVTLEQTSATNPTLQRIAYDVTSNSLIVTYNSTPNQTVQVVLVSVNGKVLLNKQFITNGGNGEIKIPVTGGEGGILIAKAALGEDVLTAKFKR